MILQFDKLKTHLYFDYKMKLFVYVLFTVLLASVYCYPARSEDISAAPSEQDSALVTDSHVRQKRGYYPVVSYAVSYPVYRSVYPVYNAVAPVPVASYSVYQHAYPATIYG